MKKRLSKIFRAIWSGLCFYVPQDFVIAFQPILRSSKFEINIHPVKEMPGTIYVFIKDPQTGCCTDSIGPDSERDAVVSRAYGHLEDQLRRKAQN